MRLFPAGLLGGDGHVRGQQAGRQGQRGPAITPRRAPPRLACSPRGRPRSWTHPQRGESGQRAEREAGGGCSGWGHAWAPAGQTPRPAHPLKLAPSRPRAVLGTQAPPSAQAPPRRAPGPRLAEPREGRGRGGARRGRGGVSRGWRAGRCAECGRAGRPAEEVRVPAGLGRAGSRAPSRRPPTPRAAGSNRPPGSGGAGAQPGRLVLWPGAEARRRALIAG